MVLSARNPDDGVLMRDCIDGFSRQRLARLSFPHGSHASSARDVSLLRSGCPALEFYARGRGDARTHGAVSQRIKRLEEHLGTPLFRRSGRGMLLTDEGRRLQERVQAASAKSRKGRGDSAKNTGCILTISSRRVGLLNWLLPRSRTSTSSILTYK